jgi:hypothetical protein
LLLPTKGLAADRSLVFLGAEILHGLSRPSTVSALWTDLSALHRPAIGRSTVTYDWFVLALNWLHIVHAIRLDEYERIVTGPNA